MHIRQFVLFPHEIWQFHSMYSQCTDRLMLLRLSSTKEHIGAVVCSYSIQLQYDQIKKSLLKLESFVHKRYIT